MIHGCINFVLDSSVALDVLDHPILLKRLEVPFGIKEKALENNEFFADRTHYVFQSGV